MADLDDTLTRLKALTAEEGSRAAALDQFLYVLPCIAFLKDCRPVLHKYVLVSRSWERIYGWRRSDAVDHTDYDLFPRERADKFRLDEHQVLEHGRAYRVIDAVGTRGSGWAPIAMELFPVAGASGQPEFVGARFLLKDYIDG